MFCLKIVKTKLLGQAVLKIRDKPWIDTESRRYKKEMDREGKLSHADKNDEGLSHEIQNHVGRSVQKIVYHGRCVVSRSFSPEFMTSG